MLWLLVKNKIICLFNGYLRGPFKRRVFRYLTLAVSGFFFYYLFSWARDFFRIILQNPELSLSHIERIQLIEHILSVGFTGFFFFLLMGGLTLSIHYIFTASDLSLLLATPLSTRTIFSYKIIETTVFNSALFLFIGGSTLLGFGFGIAARFEYYPILLGTLIPFIVIPTTFALLLSLLAVQMFSPQRIREASGALTGIITLGFWFVIQIFRISALSRESSEFDPARLKQLQDLTHGSLLDYMPPNWVTTIFTNFLHEELAYPWFNLFGLYLVACVLFAVCLFLIQRSSLKGMAYFDMPSVKKIKRPRHQKAVKPLVAGTPSFYLTLILKDIKLFLRDSRLVTQIVMLGIMMVFISAIINPEEASDLPDFMNGAYRFLFILFFASIISVQMGSRMIPLERKFFWRLKLAPNPMRRIIISKLLLSYGIAQFVTFIALLIISVYYRQTVDKFFEVLAFSIPICLGASALGGLIGTIFPRFDWEHPKHMLTPIGMILLIVVALLWWLIILLFTFIPSYLFNFASIFHPLNSMASGVLALMISFIAIWWQAKRLEAMEWQL